MDRLNELEQIKRDFHLIRRRMDKLEKRIQELSEGEFFEEEECVPEKTFLIGLNDSEWKVCFGGSEILSPQELFEQWEEWGEKPTNLTVWLKDHLSKQHASKISSVKVETCFLEKNLPNDKRGGKIVPCSVCELSVILNYKHQEKYFPPEYNICRASTQCGCFDLTKLINKALSKN